MAAASFPQLARKRRRKVVRKPKPKPRAKAKRKPKAKPKPKTPPQPAPVTYRASSYTKTAIPTAFELHLMNRLGCGYSRATWQQLRSAGGALPWLERQLEPDSVPESALADSLITWFPEQLESPTRKWQRNQNGSKAGWQYAKDFGNWSMLRRMYSRRQVLETMVDFWSNHLHVNANPGPGFVWRFDYDRVIREHALGRFEDLLVACTLHPAMLVYLDNFRSTRGAPNENHGRELLELHTVGRASGYDEQMVKDSAKILSGYTVDYKASWAASYDTSKHTTGAVRVLDFADANTSPDGAALAVRYLKYLANHRHTALTIARKVAIRFVSDEPSDALVNHLADVYLRTGTDIKAVLRALVATEEFRGSAGQKVRTNVDDLVATVRVLQVTALKPRYQKSFGNAIAYLHQGLELYQWPRPDGSPERNADWASASRMLSTFRMHWNLAVGYYPKLDARYKTPASWLPQRQLRADQFIDHLCRMLLGRGSTDREVRAVCQATGRKPGEIVTAKHPLARYLFVRMAAVLLDSPTHMTR